MTADAELEEGSHEPLVGGVTQYLRLDANSLRVLERIRGLLAGEAALQDALSRPVIDRVGCGFDFEHPVRQVLVDARPREPGSSGGPFERAELASALEDRDDATLGIEVRLDLRVLVLACDLSHPAAPAMANHDDLKLGAEARGLGDDARARARVDRGSRAERSGQARPPLPVRSGTTSFQSLTPPAAAGSGDGAPQTLRP